jgi:hypothetical protein
MRDFVSLEPIGAEAEVLDLTSPVTLRERRPAASRLAGEGSATQDAKRATSQLFRERKLVLVIAILLCVVHCFHEDCRELGTREFWRRRFTRAQHLADFRA